MERWFGNASAFLVLLQAFMNTLWKCLAFAVMMIVSCLGLIQGVDLAMKSQAVQIIKPLPMPIAR